MSGIEVALQGIGRSLDDIAFLLLWIFAALAVLTAVIGAKLR